MDILINDYINGERSLCRDEAQFSAYLFQILNGCKRVKIDSDNFTNKTYEVMQAYYMPAFVITSIMRTVKLNSTGSL